MPATSRDKLQQHMEEATAEHFEIIAKKVQLLEGRVNDNQLKEKAMKKYFVDADGALPSSRRCDSGIDNSLQSLPQHQQRKPQLNTAAHVQNSSEIPSPLPLELEKDMHTTTESMLTRRLTKTEEELRRSFIAELRVKEEEIAKLKTTVKKLNCIENVNTTLR